MSQFLHYLYGFYCSTFICLEFVNSCVVIQIINESKTVLQHQHPYSKGFLTVLICKLIKAFTEYLNTTFNRTIHSLRFITWFSTSTFLYRSVLLYVYVVVMITMIVIIIIVGFILMNSCIAELIERDTMSSVW